VGDLATLATAGSGLGAFVAVIVYLLSSNRQDRREYQDAIDKAEARADKAEAREQSTQETLDEARAARRSAEDRAAALGRELARYRPDGDP
jgi:uncharacterized membrane protein